MHLCPQVHESLEPPDDEAVISDLISEASCRAQLEQHEEAKAVCARDDALGRPSRDPAKLWERSAALEAAMRDLHVELADLDTEAATLAKKIQKNFAGLGV